MKILIAVASKHGSTREIGAAIATELEDAGHAVDLIDVEEDTSAAGYDAFVVGSAVYVGKWLPAARAFVERHREQLSSHPVWFFSSGPLGDDPHPKEDPQDAAELLAAFGARDHQNFVGKLDRKRLGLGEKMIVRAVKAPYGDYRDWDAIRHWAGAIAAALQPAAVPTA